MLSARAVVARAESAPWTRAAHSEPGTKVSYTLFESIQQLSKEPEATPLVYRPDWHATQIFLVLLFAAAYLIGWNTEDVHTVAEHQRLEIFDKRRILMLFRDERVRILAEATNREFKEDTLEQIQHLKGHMQELQQEMIEVRRQLGRGDWGTARAKAPLIRMFDGWAPRWQPPGHW